MEGAYAFDQVVEGLPGLTGVERQSDQSLGHRFCDQELAFAAATFLKRGSQVQGAVVCAHFYASLVKHGMDEIITAHAKLPGIELHWIKVKHVGAVREHDGELQPRDIPQ